MNPGPLAPKARIIPLDQRAVIIDALITLIIIANKCRHAQTYTKNKKIVLVVESI